METAADAELVRYAEKMTGYDAETVAFCTEGPYLQQLGMQTIILGPGEPTMAHKTDEFCYISKIEEASEAYLEIGRKWCGL